MDWWEILMITVGISLDIFAAVECQGALAAKVDKRRLILGGMSIAAWQSGGLFLGSLFAHLIYTENAEEQRTVQIIVVLILACLGVRMICKAVRNEQIIEHREDRIGFRKMLKLAVVTSAYTLLTGAVLGFLNTNIIMVISIGITVTFLVVILGMYTGYHLGFEQKNKAYIAGGILLIVAGIDVMIRQIFL